MRVLLNIFVFYWATEQSHQQKKFISCIKEPKNVVFWYIFLHIENCLDGRLGDGFQRKLKNSKNSFSPTQDCSWPLMSIKNHESTLTFFWHDSIASSTRNHFCESDFCDPLITFVPFLYRKEMYGWGCDLPANSACF